MKITKVVVGLLEENCYVLEKDKQVIVVDPGDEYERIKKVIGHKKVAGVLITHNHFDHVGALEEFDPSLVYKYNNLEEGEHTIGPFNFEVIYTPGHTKDSVSYYFKEDNNPIAHKRKHEVRISHPTVFLDQMVMYAGIRSAKGKIPSLKLNAIGRTVMNDEKIDYSEEGNIRTIMYKNYRSYVIYNIKDQENLTIRR